MLNIVDVFSGAGGLTEGFRSKHYFKFIGHIEMDKNACSSLMLRNVYYYLKEINNIEPYLEYIKGHITKDSLYSIVPESVTKDIFNEEINQESKGRLFKLIDSRLGDQTLDGIIGGPPCQAYSTIGRANNKAKKESDKRIYLYKYYLEFLYKYNPKFFIFENVKGLLSFKDIFGNLLFPQIIREFDEAGYDVVYEIVDASDYGVSQKRERLILMGYRRDLQLQNHFFDYLAKYKESAPNLKELFADLPILKSGESDNEYRCECLNNFIKSYYRSEYNVLTQNISRKQNDNDLKIYNLVVKAKKNGKNLKYVDIPPELQTHSNKTSFLDRYKALDFNDISHTIVAHIAKDGHYYIHPDVLQNRSITVREAARIQGFPDDFYFESSRSSAFRQIGNAVPPILSNKIASAIIDFLDQGGYA